MPESAPGRYEAGSENIVAIAGLHAALEWLKDNQHMERIKQLTDYLVNQLSKNPMVTVFDMNEQLGIVSFVVEGYDSSDIGRILMMNLILQYARAITVLHIFTSI